MTLVDTHVHLHFPDFQSDVDQVIKRAREGGVRFFINVGTDVESSRAAVQLSERYDFVYATVGVHPHDAKNVTPDGMRELKELAKHPQVESVDICTGNWEMILKVRVKDQDAYYNLVKNVISRKGINKIVSLTSLKQLKTEFVTL